MASSAAPVTKLQLCFHAVNLPKGGPLRQNPDTFAKVAIVPPQYAEGEQPVHIGDTEVIDRNCNPRWAKVFSIEYEFGTQLNVFVEVLSRRGERSTPRPIGGANFEIGDLLGSKNKTKAKRLRKGGCIFAHVEQCTSEGSEGKIRFQLSAVRLEYKVGGLNRSEPSTFFEISRQTQTAIGNKWVIVYRSNRVVESLKPTWDMAELDLETFCNGDLDRPILVSVFVSKKSGNHALLGTIETTARLLVEKAQKSSAREWHESTFVLRKGGYNAYEEAGSVAVMLGTVVPNDGTGGSFGYEMMAMVDASCEATAVTGTEQEKIEDGGGVGEVLNKATDFASTEQDQVGDEGAAGEELNKDMDFAGTEQGQVEGEPLNLASLQDNNSAIGTVLQFPPTAPRPTFAAYVDGGCEIDLCVAIDFTSSNGDPRLPGTLHHRRDGTLNDYEETILTVGGAVARYSHEHQFPCWGFGAKYGGEVRHIFQCGQTRAAEGIDGVLDAYRSVFQTDLTMSGPTVISNVIQAAAARAKKFHRNVQTDLKYCILLILTDGKVNNLPETKSLLDAASGFPLSVVIVGIGIADFSTMQDLADVSGEATRENVTFVAFRPHQHDPQSLSRAALAHVPNQIVEYFGRNGVLPPKQPTHNRRSSSQTVDSVISELSVDRL